MIVPFDFGLPGCAHDRIGRATPRAGCRQRVFAGNRDAGAYEGELSLSITRGTVRLADYPCWSMDPTHGGLVERVARLERLRLTYILMANGGEV